jgi:hypothetical protein
LKCPVLGTYTLKMNYGRWTNTRGELLALLWILFVVCIKKLTRLQLVGDSKVIIDWFSNENNLQAISLEPWLTKLRSLSENFQQLKAQHIYKIYNKEAGRISKEALLLVFERLDISF